MTSDILDNKEVVPVVWEQGLRGLRNNFVSGDSIFSVMEDS